MTKQKHILFIINPISGGVSKGIIPNAINQTIDSKKFTWEIKYTSRAGHGAALASEAAHNGVDIVVAVGGDGTINEIASSLINTETALGLIPCGSGNGLARHLHIPLNYLNAVELINNANIKEIDYGLINGKPFFCTCGVGFDAYISAKFDTSIKRGPITYIENAVMEIINYKPETYIIEKEDGSRSTHKAFLITFANASQYGNNAYIAPNAAIDDGLLDVTIIEPFNFAEAPLLALQFLNGKLPNKGNVKMFTAKKLKIYRETEGYIHCDGDPFFGSKEISVEAMPKRLKVIVNPKVNLKPIPLIQALSIVFRNKLYSNTVLGQAINSASKELIERIGLNKISTN